MIYIPRDMVVVHRAPLRAYVARQWLRSIFGGGHDWEHFQDFWQVMDVHWDVPVSACRKCGREVHWVGTTKGQKKAGLRTDFHSVRRYLRAQGPIPDCKTSLVLSVLKS